MITPVNARHRFTHADRLPAGALVARPTHPGTMQPFDTYHWEKVAGPDCVGGVLRETWCYVECAAGSCQILWCEQRTVGTC